MLCHAMAFRQAPNRPKAKQTVNGRMCAGRFRGHGRGYHHCRNGVRNQSPLPLICRQMTRHTPEPQARRYCTVACCQQQTVVVGRLHAERDCELAPAKAAGIIGQKSYEQVAVFDLKSAHYVVGVGMTFVIDHHYLKRCIIVLIKYIGQQLAKRPESA